MGRRDPDQSIGRQLLVLAIKHTDTRRVRIRQSAASHGTHYTHTVHIVARKKSKTNARRWKLAPAKSTRRDTTTTKKKGWSALSSYLSTETQSTRRKRRTWPAFSFWLSGSFGNTRRRRRTKMTAETMSSSPTSTDSYYPRIPVVCVYPFDWRQITDYLFFIIRCCRTIARGCRRSSSCSPRAATGSPWAAWARWPSRLPSSRFKSINQQHVRIVWKTVLSLILHSTE